jgi:hypothetical protein
MKIDNNTPIITLHQPWCKWISLGWKTIETRLHDRFKNLKGKRIGIHVGKKWDQYAIITAMDYLTDDKLGMSNLLRDSGGYIICTAYVEDFRELKKEDSQKSLIDCENTKRFGLFLINIEKNDNATLKFYKGRQGIWYLKE